MTKVVGEIIFEMEENMSSPTENPSRLYGVRFL
jgi:hypothetical protein